MKPANKITTDMDAHLEAHPPHIEWTEGAGGIKHGTVIEEIPLPKTKKAPKPEVGDEWPWELTLGSDETTAD